MNEKYPHLTETTNERCSQRTYMIHPDYGFGDLTDEEKEVVYQSALVWSEVHQELFNDLYDRVMEDFKTLKEQGISSEKGKEIIERWTE